MPDMSSEAPGATSSMEDAPVAHPHVDSGSARPGHRGRSRRGNRRVRKGGLPGRILAFILKSIIIVHLAYIGITSFCIIAYKYTNPAFTVLMPYRAWGYKWKLEKPMPLPLNRVPAYIRSMLVAVEDGKFYDHFGLDFEAFKRAKEINDRLGKPLYGGSTLTMQVARTLFLVPEKSYVRKYFEVITALELEIILSKERILELYFGYAEWGKGIFGIEAASRHWYGRGVSAISRDEAARLIALLSSPIRYTPSTLYKSGILRERYAYLVRRFVDRTAVSPDQAQVQAPPPGDVLSDLEEGVAVQETGVADVSDPGMQEGGESAQSEAAVPAGPDGAAIDAELAPAPGAPDDAAATGNASPAATVQAPAP
jgi:monofunctional biosynthetic peptidoglycan transglycosylase